MNAIEEARKLFKDVGLSFPPIPGALEASCRHISDWCYASRDISARSMYMFDVYPLEVIIEPIDDYVAVSHAGHGLNSYSINYHLVWGQLALFVQVLWGGTYTDNEGQAAKINAWFAKCGHLVKAALSLTQPPGKGRERLIVAKSDFRHVNLCNWLPAPVGNADTARRWFNEHESPAVDAFDAALDSLRGRAS